MIIIIIKIIIIIIGLPRLPRCTYSLYLRERIIRLSQTYKGKALISVLQKEGFRVSVAGAYYLIKKYKKTGSLFDRPRKGRTQLLPEQALQEINNLLNGDDEITTTELMHKLCEMEYRASRATIGRARILLGWTAKATRYCQLIREVNKQKRLDFCQQLVQSGDTFNNVIFTDESMVQLAPSKRKIYHKKGEARKYRPKAKHPVKVYVWGGISKQGATSCVIFTGIMDGERYTRILKAGLLPFIHSKFPLGNFRFQQDNDPKHTSRVAKKFFEDNGIEWWRTPAESPDLNPIERVWSHLKHFLTHVIKPRNKQQLVEGIQQFWRTKLTVEQCTRYINHLHRVIPVVIAKKGEAVVDDEIPRQRSHSSRH